MRILSPPRRTSISGATFTRNSEAIDSTGRIALPGLPRLEYVPGAGWITWVEEATTNLIPVDKQKFVGWAAYGGAVVTLTQNQSVPEWGCNDATRIQISGGDQIYKYGMEVLATSVSGQSYTTALYIRNNSSTDMMVSADITYLPIIVTPGQITKLVTTCVGNGTNGLGINFYAKTVEETIDITVWRLQVEPKPYPTSFIETTRAAESLTMPTTGLSVSEGTIEGIVEITDVSKRQTGLNTRLFKIVGSSGYIIGFHVENTAYWRLAIFNGTNENYVALADSLTPNGWYYYKVTWTTTEATIEIWDLSTQTKVASGTISSPYLPSAFGSYVYLGSNDGVGYFLNTRFGKHRLSNIARTADPDFDNLMSNDANTVGIFDPTPIYNQNVR
jgi:hypothetical protein